MYEKYNPGFARHKGGPSGPRCEYLWENEMIAIHWKDLPSADPSEYTDQGKAEISKLNEFARSGAIVGASYRDATKTEMLVGVVDAESPVKLLFLDGKELMGEEKVEPGDRLDELEPPEDVMVLKGLQLNDVKKISIDEYPVLFENSLRPPRVSICNWWIGDEHLRAVINEETKPFKPTSLRPDQLEVVCEEYLRIVDDGYTRLAGIGGQSADIDISGTSNGTKVWGQVTMGNSSKVASKLTALEDYSGESTRILMFAPRSSRPEDLSDGVTFLPIETVFSTVALNSSGRSMLEQMLNMPTDQ